MVAVMMTKLVQGMSDLATVDVLYYMHSTNKNEITSREMNSFSLRILMAVSKRLWNKFALASTINFYPPPQKKKKKKVTNVVFIIPEKKWF